MKKRIISAVIALSLILLAGCGTVKKPNEPQSGKTHLTSSKDLMEGVKANNISATVPLNGSQRTAAADFALRLFQNTAESGENALVSPLSVLLALGMTQNGAAGDTLSQFEQTLGLSRGEMNEFLLSYAEALLGTDSLRLANSIWISDDDSLSVLPEFLQTNADYYSADVRKAVFNDAALKEINAWVNEKTDGMIPEILDEIPPEAIMYLINALAFDAEWDEPYNEYDISDADFTTASGQKNTVAMMYGDCSTYLDDGLATGFIRRYKGDKFAFAALLPNEGVDISDYVNSLAGESLVKTLSGAKNEYVLTALPKFELDCGYELADALKAMGITDAFNGEKADFSALGSYGGENIYIGRVIHKTHIAVDENGTKAGAATAVEMRAESAMIEQKTVYLDRPFVYMIIDTETYLPVFIGTVLNIGTPAE